MVMEGTFMVPASTPGPETLCVRVVKRESIRQRRCPLTSQPCLSLSLDPFDPLPLGGGLVGLESCVASLSLNGLARCAAFRQRPVFMPRRLLPPGTEPPWARLVSAVHRPRCAAGQRLAEPLQSR